LGPYRDVRTGPPGPMDAERSEATRLDEAMTPHESLKADLAAASAELEAHMASWEYAFAMGSGRDGGRNHPQHAETRARTERLLERYRNVKARIGEHEL
jgi:hypothetical protein